MEIAEAADALHEDTRDHDCRDFVDQGEAQEFYEANGPDDRHTLDADRDGVACEALL